MSKPKHHIQQEICATRPVYREGRKPKAVKVYTVQQESQYLLVQGVPTVGASQELVQLFSSHGPLAEHTHLDSYPAEQFTEVHLLKFEKIQSARHAKRRLDNWSFFGGVLHVCYAPEYETVQETRAKLQDRRKSIAAMTRQYRRDRTYNNGPAVVQNDPDSSSVNTRAVQPTLPFEHASHPPESDYSTHTTIHSSQTHSVSNSHSLTKTLIESRTNEEMYNRSYANSSARGSHLQQVPYIQTQGIGSSTTSETNPGTPLNSDSDTFAATQSESPTVEEKLQLPPPPKQTNSCYNQSVQNKCKQTYNFARVPTANRTFPAGFDARINKSSPTSSGVQKSDNESKETVSDTVEKDKQEAANEGNEKASLVIKTFEKKGSMPRFIPRQAQMKKMPSKPAVQNGGIPSNSVSQQLKKDAFTLGAIQGAAKPADFEEADPGEMSVKQTVLHVRKQMAEVNKKSSPQIKKRKVTENL